MWHKRTTSLIILLWTITALKAQPITGVWHGKVNSAFGVQHELKLVQKGDSLVGSSYYYKGNNWTRYSVKGYFDPRTNAVIWWDDEYIAGKTAKYSLSKGLDFELEVEANYNCPGGGKMLLEGKAKVKKGERLSNTTINLEKKGPTVFKDEWDIVIENWLVGGNNRKLIDSIQQIAFQKAAPVFTEIKNSNNSDIVYKTEQNESGIITVLDLPVSKNTKTDPQQTVTNTEKPLENKPNVAKPPMEFLDLSKPNAKPIEPEAIAVTEPKAANKPNENNATKPATLNPSVVAKPSDDKPITITKIEKPLPPTVTMMYAQRKKQVLAELPIADSIELHFYDNAEVDGDSISLFLNDQLLLEHIFLNDRPYIVKLNKEQLADATELTMVAENLGAIPPNTSFMVAFINGQRYEATLSSTEKSSAVIRFNR